MNYIFYFYYIFDNYNNFLLHSKNSKMLLIKYVFNYFAMLLVIPKF